MSDILAPEPSGTFQFIQFRAHVMAIMIKTNILLLFDLVKIEAYTHHNGSLR